MVSLRLPRDLLERLDQNRMARLDKPTRGAWIKAAIAEKLDRV
ncbi:ribbon-helix-helix protein, CopG family [Rhodospirillum rubrum]|nr:ribbon-helix-helix protein, CopG family [Rhodospirillum rubrum]